MSPGPFIFKEKGFSTTHRKNLNFREFPGAHDWTTFELIILKIFFKIKHNGMDISSSSSDDDIDGSSHT